MTEREKMLAGLLYDASDPELQRLRLNARRLSRLFAEAVEEENWEAGDSLMRRLLGGAGPGLEITPPVRFDYGCNTYLGEGCYFNFNTTILDCARVEFGDNVMVGPNCSFLTPLHPLLAEERRARTAPDGRVESARVENAGDSGHEALADFLKALGVEALICGGIGAGAQNALAMAGIALYAGVTGDADRAVEELLAGTLRYSAGANCDHHSHDHHHGEGGCGGHCHN